MALLAAFHAESQRLAKEFGESALCYEVAGYPEDAAFIKPFLQLARDVPQDPSIYLFVNGHFNQLPTHILQDLLAKFQENLKATESWWAARKEGVEARVLSNQAVDDDFKQCAIYLFFSQRYQAMSMDIQAFLAKEITV